MGDAPEDDARTHPMKVQEALEGLLSKKNLGKDPYLRSAINPQMYLPLITLVAHEKMVELNATEEEVIEAALRSHRLGFDEKTLMIRPMLKSKRNTLILRDIPDDATEEEIRAVFNQEGAPKMPVAVKADINQTWFVKMESDENPADAALWLRGQQFRGRPVQCAVKSEYFLRSFFPLLQHSVFPNPSEQQSQQPLPFSSTMRSSAAPWPNMTTCLEPNILVDASLMAQVSGIDQDASMTLAPSVPSGYWKPWGSERPPLCIMPTEAPPASAMPDSVTADTKEQATEATARRSARRSRQRPLWQQQWQPQQGWQSQWQRQEQWQQEELQRHPLQDRPHPYRRWWDNNAALTQQGNVGWVSGYETAWEKAGTGAVEDKEIQQQVEPPPPPPLPSQALPGPQEAASAASQRSMGRNKKRKEAATKKWQVKDSKVAEATVASPGRVTEKEFPLLTLTGNPGKIALPVVDVGYQTKYKAYGTTEIMDIGEKGITNIAPEIPSGLVQDVDVFATAAQEPAWVSQK
eukprot:GEMP01010546.1.p1 GENE.GEMP01010546.1~~GEMP01010546.1.p1  ORF type:complete len:520 (+),score=152.67 GEMP01010546.1:254-1813(+)